MYEKFTENKNIQRSYERGINLFVQKYQNQKGDDIMGIIQNHRKRIPLAKDFHELLLLDFGNYYPLI